MVAYGSVMGRRRDALEAPALALSASLRASGHGDLAALLSEVVPKTDTGSDEHRGLLAARLREVAAHAAVSADLQEQAARLAAVADDPVVAIGRTGTVWIAWCEEAGRYDASWQADRDDPDLVYEDGPGSASLDGALQWARHRADAIVVRPEWDHGRSYWAGAGADPRGLPVLENPAGG